MSSSTVFAAADRVPPAAARSRVLGRVTSVSGAQVNLSLGDIGAASDNDWATVGKFVGIISGRALIVGLISDVNEDLRPLTPKNERRAAWRGSN